MQKIDRKKIGMVVAGFGLLALIVCPQAKSGSRPGSGLNAFHQQPQSDSAQAFTRGKGLYKTYCLSCHQFDGGGVENLNPPLIKTPFVLGDKNRMIGIVLKGFDKRVEIEGEDYSNNMPPLSYLTDQQIADVLTYVRNDFGNKASAVSAAEVHRARGGLVK